MRPKPAQAPGYIDEPIAMVRSWGTTSDTVWYLQGNNYNVEALTNRTGAIVERYAYTPYGEPTVYTAAGTDGKWFTSDDVTASVSARGNALTFQGRELDAETGVYYFRNRYYSAQMGRFVSRDPLGFGAGDQNLMRFVGNGPMKRFDPFGFEGTDNNWKGEVLVKPMKDYTWEKGEPEEIGCCADGKGEGNAFRVRY
jgi:RHS repeat-associated protein